MKRALVSAVCFCCLVLSLPISGEGQVVLGTPRFSSLGGGPFDTVNLGNLNVHFVVPIVQKAGRGVAFSYNLTYDGSIWQPVASGSTKSWSRVTSNTWGWTSSMVGGGRLTSNQSTTEEPCFQNGLSKTEKTTSASIWVYFDGFGTPHRFFGVAVHKTGCTFQDTGAGTRTALDGSEEHT